MINLIELLEELSKFVEISIKRTGEKPDVIKITERELEELIKFSEKYRNSTPNRNTIMGIPIKIVKEL